MIGIPHILVNSVFQLSDAGYVSKLMTMGLYYYCLTVEGVRV